MRTALIIGSPDSIHTVNFIDSVLINGNKVDRIDLLSIDHGCKIEEEYRLFYEKNQINIIFSDTKFGFNRLAKKIDYILRKTMALFHLTRKTRYDFCFILYCSQYNALWGGMFKSHFSKLIPVFWGGDVLRNTKLKSNTFEKMLINSHKIIMPNLNTMRVFNEKTNSKYSEKTLVIQYPQKMVSALEQAEQNLNTNECKKLFGLPCDKKIVICGHTATRAENYEEVIRNLEKCREDILRKCFFVFMMTYAPEEYHSYQKEICSLLDSSKLNGIVLKNFIPYNNVLKLHYAGDIHITAIKTDALSCFLQEELFSGSILLYGKWLNYFELENEAFSSYSFNEICELPELLNDVIDNFEKYRQDAKKNRQGIIDLASEQAIINEWNEKVF